jgi:hypothetical protein
MDRRIVTNYNSPVFIFIHTIKGASMDLVKSIVLGIGIITSMTSAFADEIDIPTNLSNISCRLQICSTLKDQLLLPWNKLSLAPNIIIRTQAFVAKNYIPVLVFVMNGSEEEIFRIAMNGIEESVESFVDTVSLSEDQKMLQALCIEFERVYVPVFNLGVGLFEESRIQVLPTENLQGLFFIQENKLGALVERIVAGKVELDAKKVEERSLSPLSSAEHLLPLFQD